MKKMKKIASLLLAMVMVFAMTATAFADETTYKLTINDTKVGHTYEVYQIFTGDISGTEDNYVLSNLKYGQNYGTEGELVPETEISKITNADTFAQVVEVKETAFKTVQSTNGVTVIEGLPAGYYLIKETTATITGQDAYTKHILQVVGDTKVDVKSDVPTVEKKVKENVKKVTGNTDTRIPSYVLPDQYNDVADYNIGDKVDFEIIGTLPSNLADYDTYKYMFTDTMDAGLTYNNDAIIYLVNEESKTEITNSFSSAVSTVDGKTVITFTCNDVTDIGGVTADSYIVVDYTATLNANAVIGLPGNENKVDLTFSNNPNKEGEGDTGTTPEDYVIVFTYELDVTKVDGKTTNTKLEGAEFKLLNSTQDKVAVVTAGKFAEWVAIDKDENGNITNGTTLTSGENGLFAVTGLDDGTYYLKETKAPTGYNLLTSPIAVVITATTANNQTWDGTPDNALTELNVTAAGEKGITDINKGTASITIANNKGATLPETGGMGTTIFYVLGVILVLGAGVVLITKKRMA